MAGGGGVRGQAKGGGVGFAASGASFSQGRTAVHGGSLLQKLQATTMLDSKPLLPAGEALTRHSVLSVPSSSPNSARRALVSPEPAREEEGRRGKGKKEEKTKRRKKKE